MLARESGIPLSTITAYEAGLRCPSEPVIAALAHLLRFPPAFFSLGDVECVSDAAASFRALTSITAGQRDAALAAGALAIELSDWIDRRFDLPPTDLPDLSNFEPEAAAQALRNSWRLAERPIKNMVHLLEDRGVRVFSLPTESAKVDAFSAWHHGRPFVFLNIMKSGERGRFDAAHELGHLTMHQDGGPRGRQMELDANRFASAFLMPHASVLACAPKEPTLDGLIKLKRNWKVAVSALVVRLRALNLLSEYRYRSLCIEVVDRGHHRDEPSPIPRETSQVLWKVLAALKNQGTPRAAIARDLAITPNELDSLILGLVISGVPGSREAHVTAARRPELTLV